MRQASLAVGLLVVGSVGLFFACGSDPSTPEPGDGGTPDSGGIDSGGLDAGGLDAGKDSSAFDAGDTGAVVVNSCTVTGDGRTNCGGGSESCCTSLPVTGGAYNRSYTNSGSGPTGEADPATVSDFRLDKYEVTVGRFRQFVAAWNGGSGWTPSAGSGKHTHLNGGSGLAATGGGYEPGWATSDNGTIAPTNANLACDANFATWTPSAAGHEKLPVNCITWSEAAAFCIWDGAFLPSEAEWEYAAAGGSQEREYPWGTAAPGMNNQYAIYGCDYPSGIGNCLSIASIAPVGTVAAGAGRYGQLDLAGSVWEWNVDLYGATYAGTCTNCTKATGSSTRVVRGGSYDLPVLPPYRIYNNPASRYSNNGIRCARTP